MTVYAEARETLKRVARGEYVPATYGAGRADMRDALAAVLVSIRPDAEARTVAAFGYGNGARVRTYDAGVAYLADAYNVTIAGAL